MTPPPTSSIPLPRLPACARQDEVAFPDGQGGGACVRVGAPGEAALATTRWPTVAGEALWVSPDASEAGVGTMQSPYRDLATAFDRAAPDALIVLARGDHALRSTFTITRPVRLIGVGAAGETRVVPPEGASAFQVTSRGVEFSSLSVEYTSAQTMALSRVAFDVRPGASLNLARVRITRADVGIQCEGAAVTATETTVGASGAFGVRLNAQSTATLRRVVIQDGLGVGLSAFESHVQFVEGLVARHGNAGVSLAGPTDPMTGAADCGAADLPGAAGPFDCLVRVAAVANRNVAFNITGNSTAGIPTTRRVDLRRVLATDTRAMTTGGSAVGLFVGGGAVVALDRDAPDVPPNAHRVGERSRFERNAQAGVLADGPGTSLTLRGVFVRDNLGPGVFFQDRVDVPEVKYSLIHGNLGIGVGATGARVGEITCNGIAETRMTVLTFTSETGPVPYRVADGISIDLGLTTARVIGNRIDANQRFPAVFSGGMGEASANQGENNAYNIIGQRAGAAYTIRDNMFSGGVPPPAMFDVATGTVSR